MFEPKYFIQLDKMSNFEEFMCLGRQLKLIIETLSELIEPHFWLCADVDACSLIPKKLGIDTFKLKKIGTDPFLIDLCENIDQFLSGVFIAIRDENQDLDCSELSVGTEDDQFRSLSLEGVLIEIRAFDTSYFEIYSENKILMNKLSEIYKVKLCEVN